MLTRLSNHNGHAELWFRPIRGHSPHAIAALIESGRMCASPRLGMRDANHPKGYRPGQDLVLRVLRDENTEYWHTRRSVLRICMRKPMHSLTSEDLKDTLLYPNWQQVHEDFLQLMPKSTSIMPQAGATIVHWSPA